MLLGFIRIESLDQKSSLTWVMEQWNCINVIGIWYQLNNKIILMLWTAVEVLNLKFLLLSFWHPYFTHMSYTASFLASFVFPQSHISLSRLSNIFFQKSILITVQEGVCRNRKMKILFFCYLNHKHLTVAIISNKMKL